MCSLKKACAQFLAHLDVERRLAPQTVTSYAYDLRRLQEFLLSLGMRQATDLTPHVLAQWLQDLAKAGLQAKSQARARVAVRQLCKFLLRERILPTNPAQHLQTPKAASTLPKVPSSADTLRLLEIPNSQTARGQRDRAALELMYGSGLRVSEVCQLRLADIDLRQQVVRPLGKGNKDRLVPMGQPSVAALNHYLQDGRLQLLAGKISEYVFIGNCARALSRMALFKIIRRYGRIAGIHQPLSPHDLRHACATHMLQGGADLRVVQEILGHANIATTEVYTHICRQDLQQTMDMYHPLGHPRKRS